MVKEPKIKWWNRIEYCPICGEPFAQKDEEQYRNEDGEISIWYYGHCANCQKDWALNDVYSLTEKGMLFEVNHVFD